MSTAPILLNHPDDELLPHCHYQGTPIPHSNNYLMDHNDNDNHNSNNNNNSNTFDIRSLVTQAKNNGSPQQLPTLGRKVTPTGPACTSSNDNESSSTDPTTPIVTTTTVEICNDRENHAASCNEQEIEVNIPSSASSPRKLDTTPNVNNSNSNNSNSNNSNNKKRKQFIGNFLRPLFKCLLTPGNGSNNGSGTVAVSGSLSCEKSSTTTLHTIDNGEEQSIKTNNTSYEMEDCEQPKYFSDSSCNNTSCTDKEIICASATPIISTTAHVKNSPRKKPIKKKTSKSSSRSNSKNDRAVVAYSVPSTGFSDMKGILPPQPAALAGRKTLVLDLDETLVHSKFDPVIGADFEIPIDLDGRKHVVYVLKRPHVDEFLREMGKHFEIVVFTASLSKYANPLLDKLDKHGVVAGRLFREHCTFVDHCYIKDLSRLGRDIDQSLIIDNSPACYAFQPLNAMPCSSWFGDQNDTQLLQMIPWLQRLAKEDTVYRALDEWRTYLNPQWY